MFKKVISYVLVLIMLLSLSVSAADNMLLIAPQGDVMPIGDDPLDSTPVFSDVASDAVYKPSIDILIKNGVISGYPDGTFRPEKPITRAEMCKVINLAFGYTDTTGAAGFPDLEQGAWYVPYVLAAQKAGYILGDPNGNFRPSSNITREEVCAILYRIIKPFDLPITVNITDNVSEWAKNYVDAIVKNSIIPLEEGGKFRSTEAIKRFELAVAVAPYSVGLEKISCVVTFGDGDDMFTQPVVIGAQMPALPEPKKIPAGMKFTGWSLSPDEPVFIDSTYVFMGATKLYPVFEKLEYTIQFMADGSILSTQKVAHGEKPMVPYAPKMTGYEFIGWAVNGTDTVIDIDNYTASSNVVFNAIFESVNKIPSSGKTDGKDDGKVVEYNVTFVSNGRTVDTQKIAKNGYPDIPEDPSLNGYVFLHWSLTPDGDAVEVGSYAVTAATTFFAVFEEKPQAKKYTVSFMADSDVVSTQTVTADGYAQTPAKPSKKNYIFKGWSLEENGEPISVASYAIFEDTVFYAVFEEVIASIAYYDVTFKLDGDEYDSQSVAQGKFATLPDAPSKKGYTFLYWSLSSSGSEVDVESYSITKNTVFYAIFEKNPELKKFNVEFIADGEVIESQTVTEGNYASSPADPTLDGFKFLRWSLEEDGKAVNVDSYTITEDTVFYAVFEEVKITLYYDVVFMSEGYIYDTQEGVKGGTSATMPEPPEKAGYDFLYWSLEENGDEVDVESHIITSETVFYAVFELKANPNDPAVITALDKAIKDFTKVTFRTSEEKAIKSAILSVMNFVYMDATELLLVIDTDYIQTTYSDDLSYIRGLVSDLDDDSLSQFITRISNNIDDESFDILADYFLTEDQKDQLLNGSI